MKYSVCILLLVAFAAKEVFGVGGYIGCYKDTSNRDLAGYLRRVGASNRVETCVAKCRSLGFKYAGLQATWWCLCGNRFGTFGKRPELECNNNCPGDKSRKCGAGWRNSVYATGYQEQYIGCFEDKAQRDLVGYIHRVGPANKVQTCVAKCRSLGYKYAGLQATHWCLCGNRYGTYGRKPERECSGNCPGDSSQKCGAGWRNSVYSTGQNAVHEYKGCYEDKASRDLVGYIHPVGRGNTVGSCITTCWKLGYKYAGVQATNWCLCGDSYGNYGKRPEVQCNGNCPGNNSEKCGAGWRNSVYSAGYNVRSCN